MCRHIAACSYNYLEPDEDLMIIRLQTEFKWWIFNCWFTRIWPVVLLDTTIITYSTAGKCSFCYNEFRNHDIRIYIA